MASATSLHFRRYAGIRVGTARLTTAAVLTLCAALNAIAAPTVTVLTDRLLTGHGHGEFVPRFAGFLPNSLRVPAGTTMTLPAEATYDAIEVAGTLKCPSPFRLRVVHLMILPGGTLDCRVAGTIEIRDVAIDTRRDPYQLGNGLIVAGRLLLGVVPKTVRAELTSDAMAGATTLDLSVPPGWSVGDELLLPDMRQPKANYWSGERVLARRESRVYIAAITEGKITLSKALDFEHLAVRDLEGNVAYRPRVANLSRSTVLRSEKPDGTRGHSIMLGPKAGWHIEGVLFENLGRTTAEPLDSTTADESGAITHVGTNQIGRYAFHVHMVGDARGSVFRGNAMTSDGIAKTAHAVHMTENVVTEESIAVGFVGAGFVTEDGPERNNLYRRVVAAYMPGVLDLTRNGGPLGAKEALEAHRPFAEGAGFWARGAANTWEDFESWNNNIGFVFMYRRQVSSPDFEVRDAAPAKLVNFLSVGDYFASFETWGAPYALLGEGLHLVNPGSAAVRTGSAEAGNLWLKDLHVLCSDEERSGVESAQAYTDRLTIDGGSIRGCAVGVRDSDRMVLKDLFLQNVINIDRRTAYKGTLRAENVVAQRLRAHSPQHVLLGVHNWRDGLPLPRSSVVHEWTPTTGARVVLKNWQRSNQDFYVYTTDQLRSKPAYPALEPNRLYAPEEGLTLGETWDRWGIALGGGTISESEAEQVEGVINGVAKKGSDIPLGPPRAVLNAPNRTGPAAIRDGWIDFWLTPSGRSDGTNHRVQFRIDDGPTIRPNISEAGAEKGSRHRVRAASLVDGIHTVTTWREDLEGKRIDSSMLTFTFVVDRRQPLTTSLQRD
jgi:hypothetical protein